MNYLSLLIEDFIVSANNERAISQKAYMRGQFDFFGLSAPERKTLSKPYFIKSNLPDKKEVESIIKALWNKRQREYQYFAQELLQKYTKQFEKDDIHLIEYMAAQHPWWDTVDFIAVNLMGPYFKKFPEQIEVYTKKWLDSEHLWLKRCAILFQLKYKEDLNPILLSEIISTLTPSNEFFINKAIGWILREYSRTSPEWVIDYATKTTLSTLSKREALRLIT